MSEKKANGLAQEGSPATMNEIKSLRASITGLDSRAAASERLVGKLSTAAAHRTVSGVRPAVAVAQEFTAKALLGQANQAATRSMYHQQAALSVASKKINSALHRSAVRHSLNEAAVALRTSDYAAERSHLLRHPHHHKTFVS